MSEVTCGLENPSRWALFVFHRNGSILSVWFTKDPVESVRSDSFFIQMGSTSMSLWVTQGVIFSPQQTPHTILLKGVVFISFANIVLLKKAILSFCIILMLQRYICVIGSLRLCERWGMPGLHISTFNYHDCPISYGLHPTCVKCIKNGKIIVYRKCLSLAVSKIVNMTTFPFHCTSDMCKACIVCRCVMTYTYTQSV